MTDLDKILSQMVCWFNSGLEYKDVLEISEHENESKWPGIINCKVIYDIEGLVMCAFSQSVKGKRVVKKYQLGELTPVEIRWLDVSCLNNKRRNLLRSIVIVANRYGLNGIGEEARNYLHYLNGSK